MTEVENWLGLLLGVGLESKELGVWQMGLRAIVVYVVTVIMVRLGKKRFLGRATAFDVILGIMLGSIVSRAVTGNAPMLPALVASAVLVLMHFVFSGMALRWHGFGSLIKGNPRLIVRDGAIDERSIRKAHMTEHDLHEDLRSKSVARLDQVA
ncbi:MAG TPA: YetF domain-containing protein, partial [Enterovirga sp.]|nr:YetF domain-containing protein [Enterovirga sp.]